MTYGAMAIYEDNPELARKIINRALETIVISMADYGPDGAYPEGYGYWGYGTSFNVMFVSAIEKLFGKDFGLAARPGFLKTAGFLENMTGPSGKPFNFSDAGNEGGFQPAMFWFASKLKDPSLVVGGTKPAAIDTGSSTPRHTDGCGGRGCRPRRGIRGC